MRDLLVPTHFRDVYKPFDTLFQLDENAVVDYADDLAPDFAARRILFRRVHPRIGHQLLQSERNALLFLIELEDDDVQLLLRLHHVRWMLDAPPTQIREVQQPVNSPQIDK